MAKPKYETVEEAVQAWREGKLKVDNLKKNYYHTLKIGNDRAHFYREVIYNIELIKLKEQWG